MLDFPPELIKPVGNTALLGAKMSLFELDRDGLSYTAIRKRIQHVALISSFMPLLFRALGPLGPLLRSQKAVKIEATCPDCGFS